MLWWRNEGKLTYCNSRKVVEGLRNTQKNLRHAERRLWRDFNPRSGRYDATVNYVYMYLGSENTSRLHFYAVLTSTSRLRRHDSQCEGVTILQNLQEHRWDRLTSRKFRDNWGKLCRIICFRLDITGSFRRWVWLQLAFQGCSCT